MTAIEAPREQTRARYPDQDGYVERDGVRLFYEVYGTGDPTVLLLPTWSILHSRHWKAQIPYLARHCRVVTFDGRGNGRTDHPATVDAYAEREFAADALAVMDATATDRAILVSLSAGALWGTLLAAEHPERVSGVVFIAAAAPFGQHLARVRTAFDEPLESYEGWEKYNSTTGSRTTATSSSSSSRRCSPSRTRRSSSRTVSAGASRRRPRPWR